MAKEEGTKPEQAKDKGAAPEKDLAVKIYEDALEAYGIEPRYVLGHRVDEAAGEVVIVTHGGAKVRYRAGDKPAPLSPVRVTGVNPEAARRKPVAGRK